MDVLNQSNSFCFVTVMNFYMNFPNFSEIEPWNFVPSVLYNLQVVYYQFQILSQTALWLSKSSSLSYLIIVSFFVPHNCIFIYIFSNRLYNLDKYIYGLGFLKPISKSTLGPKWLPAFSLFVLVLVI